MSLIDDLLNGAISIDEFLKSQSESIIQSRMLDRVDVDLDKSVGSYIWDSVTPSSFEFALAYIALRMAIKLAVPQTSYGEVLAMQAASHGVDKKLAQSATGLVTVSGVVGTKIAKGVKFSTTVPEGSLLKPKYFTTTEEKTIGTSGSVDISVKADTAGSDGNVIAGEINFNIQSIPGVTGVYNALDFTNGIDEESDPALLTRLLEKVRNPPSSGNKNDYIRWSKEVPGVGEVIVKALWNGPGSVKIIILDPTGQPVTQDVIDDVKEYLDPGQSSGEGDGKAPVGAVVTVVTASVVSISVTIPSMQVESGYSVDAVKASITEKLSQYLASIPPGGTVRLKEAESAISNVAGVLDFGSILLSGASSNIFLGEEEKAMLGAVTYT